MSEGDTLYLSCDGSNSDPLPTLHWVSLDGETVSDTGQLVIMDITRNRRGMYSCVATLPNSTMTLNTTVNVNVNEGKTICVFIGYSYRGVFLSLVYCEELESTDTIIVHITSTAMGSNGTYQCRDGPTDDVYTTQCTSDGVWDPNTLSTLDCTKSGSQG